MSETMSGPGQVPIDMNIQGNGADIRPDYDRLVIYISKHFVM